MKQTNTIFSQAVLCLLLMTAGGIIGYMIAFKMHALPNIQQQPVPNTEASPKILYWYDPMVPDKHFDKPGKSPFMDMDLVPKYADTTSSAEGVRINSRMRQNINVRLGVVEKTHISDETINTNDVFTVLPTSRQNTVATTSNKTHVGLVVPSEAVIATGRHSYVIIAQQDGYFNARKVATGKTQNEKTEIVSGLSEGEKVVTSGQFLIDSEANFYSTMSRMNNVGAAP